MNRLKVSADAAMAHFVECGWRLSASAAADAGGAPAKLDVPRGSVLWDPLVPDLIVLPPRTSLHKCASCSWSGRSLLSPTTHDTTFYTMTATAHSTWQPRTATHRSHAETSATNRRNFALAPCPAGAPSRLGGLPVLFIRARSDALIGNGTLILQDRSSCLSAWALQPSEILSSLPPSLPPSLRVGPF